MPVHEYSTPLKWYVTKLNRNKEFAKVFFVWFLENPQIPRPFRDTEYMI